MATRREVVEKIEEALAGAGEVRLRKMFGEYGLYLGEKFVGVVAEDNLYLKITKGSRAFLDQSHDEPPYGGASPYHLIPEDRWPDHEWLHEMLRQVADDLPEPKPKKSRKSATS